MHTRLAPGIAERDDARRAAELLRACVHCGFCNAACPTYRLLGDELDGPRGRIYQIKGLLEGDGAAPSLHTHLDRCLSCRACESSCPSGVRYGELLDIGRGLAEQQVPRSRLQSLQRALLRAVLPYPRRFAPLLALGRAVRGLLPRRLRASIPAAIAAPGAWPEPRHPRRMVALRGCVQGTLAPATNAAAARVLDRLGISLVEAPQAGCCGALSHHLAAAGEGLDFARRNIDAWWPLLEQGAEAVVMSASGCGVHVRDYGALLATDPHYADKAARVSAAVRDLCEVIDPSAVAPLALAGPGLRVAFHTPCTLQHGQKLNGRVEALLAAAGCEIAPVADAALCCGSAGSYALLQPALADTLGTNKVRALQLGAPVEILSANIGCQLHLGGRTELPVRHWVELMDERLDRARPAAQVSGPAGGVRDRPASIVFPAGCA